MTALVPPWLWEIRDAAGRVRCHGEQWTRPLATPQTVAEERAAVLAYRLILAGRKSELDGLVCRVCRPGSARWVEVPVGVWARRAEAARTRQAQTASPG